MSAHCGISLSSDYFKLFPLLRGITRFTEHSLSFLWYIQYSCLLWETGTLNIYPTTHYVSVPSCWVQLPALTLKSEYNQMHVSLRCKNNCCQIPTVYFNILYRCIATYFGLYASGCHQLEKVLNKKVRASPYTHSVGILTAQKSQQYVKNGIFMFHYIISAGIDVGQLCKALGVPVQCSSWRTANVLTSRYLRNKRMSKFK